MQPAARLQAAIDILTEIVERGRGAPIALSDWGRSHRFAGSGDRAAIGNLVYDALRQKQSLGFAMRDGSPRAVVLGVLRLCWGLSAAEISALCDGAAFAPKPLSVDEQARLEDPERSEAPPWIAGDYPEWLHPSFSAAFGEEAMAEGRALAQRAPIDLRVNTLKATREKVLKAFQRYSAVATPISPLGVRLPQREGASRSPNVESDPAHGRGWFEVQDEGSQIAALIASAGPRMQVADICAGAGGKTLAMAAQMQNTGQIYAYDADATRFRPIFERLKRAGARNVQTLAPGQDGALDALAGRMDLVLIDAPCSGTGVWRRRPDAKWRLTPAQLAERIATQSNLLDRAAGLVRDGGTVAYVTCSVLPEENENQIEAFLNANEDFSPVLLPAYTEQILPDFVLDERTGRRVGIRLTPARHGTDGFYIALLTKNKA
jgi:16S rRNA (cytosine967-C5)-methyltransferase